MMAATPTTRSDEPALRVRIVVDASLHAKAVWAAEALLARAGVRRWELVGPGDDVDLAFEHDPAAWEFAWNVVPDHERDPLAATFWWLARVEELLAPEDAFDEHGRFQYASSALARGGEPFATPVDDVARALPVGPWVRHDVARRWTLVPTHDIDMPWRWTRAGKRRAARTFLTAVRAGEVSRAWVTLLALLAIPIWGLRRSDPWSNAGRIRTFEWSRGARSTSYVLMARNVAEDGPQEVHDRGRERYVRGLVTGTERRFGAGGGLVGLHGSYVTSVTPGRIGEERRDLEQLVGDAVVDHRFHYLRHRPVEAWPMLAAAGIGSDATLGYAEQPGFRAGTAHAFRAWSHEDGHALDLVVIPLAFMDASLDDRYLAMGPVHGATIARAAVDRVREVGGCASVLFHNDRLCCVDSRPWTKLYGELLDQAAQEGGGAVTAREAAVHYRAALPAWLHTPR